MYDTKQKYHCPFCGREYKTVAVTKKGWDEYTSFDYIDHEVSPCEDVVRIDNFLYVCRECWNNLYANVVKSFEAFYDDYENDTLPYYKKIALSNYEKTIEEADKEYQSRLRSLCENHSKLKRASNELHRAKSFEELGLKALKDMQSVSFTGDKTRVKEVLKFICDKMYAEEEDRRKEKERIAAEKKLYEELRRKYENT